MDFEDKALHSRNILVTRPQEQVFEFASKLIEEGANIYLLPTVKITVPENYKAVDEALTRLGTYEWLIFSSANSVRYFFERFNHFELKTDTLKNMKIAAVGPATAHLLEAEGLKVDFIPTQHTADNLAKSINNIEGARILNPTTDITRGNLKSVLEKRGAFVDEVAFYHTRRNEIANEYIEQTFAAGIDIITFTSSSSVEALIELTDPLHINLNKYDIACIGPYTADTAKEHGLHVNVIASPYTLDGLVSEIINYYASKEVKKA